MQQGHPRRNQLNRADREMYLHNRHKAEGVWNEIKNVMTGINKVISVVGKQIGGALELNKQMSAPNIDYDKFEIKDIATDMFRNNAGIINGK